MKKIFLCGSLVLLILGLFYYKNNNSPKIIIANLINNNSIKSGDLVYSVTFLNMLPIGEAILNKEASENYDGEQILHLQGSAKTNRIISRFFDASAKIDSFINKNNYNPLLFRQILVMPGKPEEKKEIFYDQSKGVMKINNVERSILPDTNDPLSLLFKLEKMDLSRISNIEMSLNTNQKNYVMTASVTSKTLVVAKASFNLYFLKGDIRRRDKNNPFHRTKIYLVFIKEKDNIPVLMKVVSSGAVVNIKLIGVR